MTKKSWIKAGVGAALAVAGTCAVLVAAKYFADVILEEEADEE